MARSATVGVESQVATLPTGSSDQETVYFDSYGLPVWVKDAGGYLHYLAYDRATGAVTKTIGDVNTTLTGDFTGKPSGWTTPTGAGLHAIAVNEVDGQGRPTKSTDANGNITYTVHDDVDEEIRVYPGWNTGTNTTTGPTIVVRSDGSGAYSEVLTMTATPAVTGGRPTGTEAISGLQSLSRTFYNDALQAIRTDDYFNLAGLTYTTAATLGTLNTHFYRTEYAYDKRGRHSKTVGADGTIFRTVFDGLARPVSEWVGDDDIPDTGFWSPTNPAGMVKIKEYQYDTGGIGDGHLTRISDALSRHTTLAYDFRGRLLSATLSDPDAGGSQTSPVYSRTYDNLGRVLTETDPLSNVTAYAYDLVNRKVTTTLPDPDGGGPLTSPVFVSTADSRGNLVTSRDPLLNDMTYAYDGLSRLVTVTLPDPDGAGALTSPVTTFQYDLASNLRFTTDPLGHITEQTYDKIHRLTQTILPDPDGAGSATSPITGYGYNSAGLLSTVTDPLSRVTTYEYDALERLTKITQPDPDSGGSLTSPVTQFGYDGASRRTSVTDPLLNVTSYAYNFFDQLTTVTAPDPDGAGGLTSPVTTYSYNAADELLSITDPLSRLTSYEYDNIGRRTKETLPDPDGAGPLARPLTTFTYDAASNLQTVTDPLSHVTDYDYDNLHRRTKITDAETGQTSFTYDAAGRVLTLKDPVNNTTTWQYDTLGRVTQETNQLSESRTFKYDAASNLTERVDRLGRKIEYVYDNLDRNTSEKWWDGANLVRTLSFAFNAASELTSASDPAATYTYSYDALSRVTSEGQTLAGLTPGLTYGSKYDANSRRTELQAVLGGTNDFKNTYTYDNLSRLTRLQQQDVSGGNVVADKRIDFAYDASGAFTKIDRYADQTTSEHVASSHYSYDGMGRLTKLLHTEGPTAPGSGWGTDALAGYEYVYDAASRFTSINSFVDGLTTFTHDDTDQLIGADHTGQTDETYTYDANGNRTMTGYTVGTNNQISTDGTYNYTYDDEGNRLTKTKISNGDKEDYTWDHRNRLTNVTFKNSGGTVTKTVDHTYDVFNQWIRRSVDPDGATGSAAIQDTFFSHEDGQVALEFDGAAAADLTHRYTWGPAVDQLLADEVVTSLTSAGTMLWPLADHLGTLRDLATYNTSADDTAVANHRRYDSYGKLISETNAAVDELFGFTGRILDDSTGLQNNLNRWYDATTGQWPSEDPIGFGASDSNLRRYVMNSTLDRLDPSGLEILIDADASSEDTAVVLAEKRRYVQDVVNALQKVVGPNATLQVESLEDLTIAGLNITNKARITYKETTGCGRSKVWSDLKKAIDSTKSYNVYWDDDTKNAEWDEDHQGDNLVPPLLARGWWYPGVYINPQIDTVGWVIDPTTGGAIAVKFSFESILWHELIGHGLYGNPHEQTLRNTLSATNTSDFCDPAVAIENDAHRALGEPQRVYKYIWTIHVPKLGARLPFNNSGHGPPRGGGPKHGPIFQ